MGNSSGEGSAKPIDASVGGLVWVRRRNGSWWPGRIMGLDEVSESCLVSPRSGTPVKLLGREDASVDWYNLEKSKRVKSFRCGEYDECIAKAKASAANSSKKAVKYARREDAIIHALEIENSRLVKDPVDYNGQTTDLGSENGESPSVSANPDDDGDGDDVSDSEENSDSAQDLPQSGLSFEEPNHVSSSSKVQSMQGRRRTPNDSEDDGTEGVKRMRGLQDLGVVTASKRKLGLLELVQQENASLSDINNGKSFPNGNSVNGMKRKRTPVVNAHEILKKKNRRRPLTKVLESTTMVSVPIVCNQEYTEIKRSNSVTISSTVDCNGVSGRDRAALIASEPTLIKEKEISSPFPEDDSSERLFDVPFIEEKKQSKDPSREKPQVVSLKRQSSQSDQAEGISVKDEAVNEAAVHTNIGQRLEKGTSKWQSKGKRNTRKLSRIRSQHLDADDEPDPCNGIGSIPVSVDQEAPEASGPTPQRLLPHRQSRSMVHSRYRAVDFSVNNLLTDSSLVEVKVEVKASYKPRHVPLVSLMSKLNGKAIVGHPLTVEALEDGFCDRMLRSAEGNLVNKAVSQHKSSKKKKKAKKTKKKKLALVSKKIRKLSSLTGNKKSEERKPWVEKSKGPVIACIPLKLVFSRINEAVNGSARQIHRV